MISVVTAPVLPTASPLTVPSRPDQTGGKRIGVLLQHGFTGSPASMRPWAEALANRGYAVSVPRLPGHGTTWQDMNRTTWADWYAEVAAAYDRLLADNDQVVVAGLSMGGALVLRLAADRPGTMAGVILVNPAVASNRLDVKLLPVLKHLIGGFPGVAGDIKKPGVSEEGYGTTPLKAAHSMMQAWPGLRRDLGRVSAPILFFRSTVDHVVDPSSSKIIAAGVSSDDYTERMLPESYHVATLDNDFPVIVEESAAFIDRVTAQ